MPIFDYDGAEYREIGKLVDYDGAQSSPLGEVYDYDGAEYRLIYTAETQALTAFSWGGHYNPNGAYQDLTVSNGQITASVTAYINKSVWTTQKIDLSQYSKLTVKYQVTAFNTVNGYAHFGVVAHSSQSYTYCGDTQTTNFQTDYGANLNYKNLSVGTYTKSFDISSWTGSKYLGVIIGVGGDGGGYTIKVTEVILE